MRTPLDAAHRLDTIQALVALVVAAITTAALEFTWERTTEYLAPILTPGGVHQVTVEQTSSRLLGRVKRQRVKL